MVPYSDPVIPAAFSRDFQDPKLAYDVNEWLKTLPEGERLGFLASQSSRNAAAEQAERQRNASIGSLQEAQGRFTSAAAEADADPFRQRIRDILMERTQPGYQAITDQEQVAARNALAQNIAVATGAQEARAASSGNLGSAPNTVGMATTRAVGEAAGSQMTAEAKKRNLEAMDRSLYMLSQMDEGDRRYDLAIADGLASIDRAIAALRAGNDPEPTDFLAFTAMDQARIDHDQQEAFAQQELDRLDRELEFGWDDALQQFTAARGSGLLEPILNAGTKIFGFGGS